MSWRQLTIRIVMLSACWGVSADAGVISYETQKRSVSSTTFGPGGKPTQTIVAPDFGPFNATAITLDPNGGGGTQIQNSVLGGYAISVNGTFKGGAPAFFGAGYVTGSSVFEVTFDIVQDTPATLTAQARVNDGELPPRRTISLTGPGMNVMWSPDSRIAGDLLTYSQQGTLTPGTYQMVVDLDSVIGATSVFPSDIAVVTGWSALLTVPEPGGLGLCSVLAAAALRRRAR